MIKLNISVSGKGPDLVLIHGWAMSSLVWKSWLIELEKEYTVYCVDLPGHGDCSYVKSWGMDDVLESLEDQLPPKCHVLGWSLGGMVALAYASRYPQRVERLIMLASSAKFVQSVDWSHAQEVDTLEMFSVGLIENTALTIKRFLMLQAQGFERPKKTISLLKSLVAEAKPVQEEALISGLGLLKNTDLREELQIIRCPLLMLMGENDQLIPLEVGVDAQAINPDVKLNVVNGAAHAAFLSHQADVHRAVTKFLSSEADS
ncbi:MAG: hypothetical protein A6F70_05745 [Cycloclasticus sp. symbiont of Bathymodiolus heckerae]|nr:MAG: hypothetical protein A6F70_05745 [Cycloclasticus sp. symbiont of Bathymodiolus heckerae]